MEPTGNPPPYQNLPPPSPQGPVVIRPQTLLGRDPVQLTCGNCNQQVITTVVPETGVLAWLAALVILFVFFPLFWVPLVIDACKDYRHYCPACNIVLGVYKRI